MGLSVQREAGETDYREMIKHATVVGLGQRVQEAVTGTAESPGCRGAVNRSWKGRLTPSRQVLNVSPDVLEGLNKEALFSQLP